jgi:hypothetical protein
MGTRIRKRKARPKGEESERAKGFFDISEPWEEEWCGMPEFEQEDRAPFKTIYVHFESREDVEAFSDLVGQRVSTETKFMWYPKKERKDLLNYRCADADPEKRSAGRNSTSRKKRRRRRR